MSAPVYFDALIEGYRRGLLGRRVHLGHWDGAPRDGESLDDGQRRLDDAMLALAAVEDGAAVLDVGCGFGGTLEAIDDRGREMRLVGLNVDSRQLAICATLRSRRNNRLAWVEGDACRLPFADGTFDRVLCVEAMFHFASRRAFFAEASRVLAPGGRLVASDIVPGDAGDELPASACADLVQGYGPWPDPGGRNADHDALARAAGLEPLARIDATVNVLPSFRFTLPEGADAAGAGRDPMLRAGIALRDLHRAGQLAYLYLGFGKPRRACP